MAGLRTLGEAFEQVGEAEAFGPDDHAAGLDFGQVEQVVDQVEQALAGAEDVADVAAGLGVVGGGVLEQFGEAEDGVEGGAELVADVGEELVLEAVGLVEGDVAFGQLADLGVEDLVGLPQLLGVVGQVDEHGVEGLGELLELVAGDDVGADVEVAGGDLGGRSPGGRGRAGGSGRW